MDRRQFLRGATSAAPIALVGADASAERDLSFEEAVEQLSDVLRREARRQGKGLWAFHITGAGQGEGISSALYH